MHTLRCTMLLAIAMLAGACNGTDARAADRAAGPDRGPAAPAAASVAAATHEVRMVFEGGSARFEPATLTIRAGDVVRFVNAAGGPHNVSFDPASVPDGAERVLSAAMPGQIQPLVGPLVTEPNGVYTISFAGMAPGRYEFYCLPHRAMGMTGTIVVEAAGAAAQASAALPADSPSAQAAPASGQVRLGVGRSDRYGAYVTDAGGRALYLLEDGRDCYDACMGVWPPLLAGGAAAAASDPALRPERIGTARRRDGMLQVTYGGHPLYYYVGDRGPGDTMGQHVEDAWGEWYLVGPEGREVEGERRGGRGRGRAH